jgi:hypothetical protein
LELSQWIPFVQWIYPNKNEGKIKMMLDVDFVMIIKFS